MRDAGRASARHSVPTGAAAHRDNRGRYSKQSRLSRFGLFVVQTRRNAPFIFAPPCQSELKRTLRHGGRPPNSVYSRGFNLSRDAHSTQMVNDRFPARSIYGFEMVDAPIVSTFL